MSYSMSTTGGSLSIGTKFSVDVYGNLNSRDGVFDGTVKAENISAGVIDVSAFKSSSLMMGYTVFYNQQISYNGPKSVPRTYSNIMVSRGSIKFYNYGIRMVLFEIHLKVKKSTIISQQLLSMTDRLHVIIDDYKAAGATARETFKYYPGHPGDESILYETGHRWTTGPTGSVPLSFTLPAGIVKVQYIILSTEPYLSINISGDFIDGDNISFI